MGSDPYDFAINLSLSMLYEKFIKLYLCYEVPPDKQGLPYSCNLPLMIILNEKSSLWSLLLSFVKLSSTKILYYSRDCILING